MNQENEYRALVEKRIQLEPNDWPKFQDHLKNTYTRPNFSKHKFNKKLKMKKNPMWDSLSDNTQMTDVKLLLLLDNIQNHLTVCKQMIKSK